MPHQLSEIYPYIIPELPNCPQALVDLAIIDAAREFARRTELFRGKNTVNVSIGQKSHYISDGYGQNTILDVKIVLKDNIEIPHYNSDMCRLTETETGNTLVYYVLSMLSEIDTTITLYPTPTENYSLDIHFTTQPSLAPSLHDSFFTRWHHCIAAKVKAMLMSQANKPWSNTTHVNMYNAEWWRLIADAKIEAAREYGNPVSSAFHSLDGG